MAGGTSNTVPTSGALQCFLSLLVRLPALPLKPTHAGSEISHCIQSKSHYPEGHQDTKTFAFANAQIPPPPASAILLWSP